MAYQYIVCDPDLCIGCTLCEFACSAVKHQVINQNLSRIRNVRIEPLVMMSVSCRMCEDPACVISCPRLALSQSSETGVIIVDDDKCDGCGWCIQACEFGSILLNSEGKTVEICDLCEGEVEPLCVKFCHKEALTLSTPQVVAQKARREVVTKLLQELLGEEVAST